MVQVTNPQRQQDRGVFCEIMEKHQQADMFLALVTAMCARTKEYEKKITIHEFGTSSRKTMHAKKLNAKGG